MPYNVWNGRPGNSSVIYCEKWKKKWLALYPYPICINDMWYSTFAITMVADQTQYTVNSKKKKDKHELTFATVATVAIVSLSC